MSVRKYCHYCPRCRTTRRFWTLRSRLAYGIEHLFCPGSAGRR